MATDNMEELITTSDVAHMLHVHINTVRRWADQGLIRAFRIGTRGDRRFRIEDIVRFLGESAINNNGTTKGEPAASVKPWTSQADFTRSLH